MKINTTNKNHTMWIAKFPKYLAERILSARGELDVGRITIKRADDGAGTVLEIALADAFRNSNIPYEHIMDIKEKQQGIYIVRNGSDQMVLEGHVNKEAFIRPVINERYLGYKRLVRSSSSASTKIIDYFKEVRKGEKYGSLKELDILARKRKMMLQGKKRERLESQDVYDMIFHAFEQRPSWTVKDLADFTGQPVAYIQELVADICVMNKKDHKNAYELKPEYKGN